MGYLHLAANASTAQDWVVDNDASSDEDVDVEIYTVVDGQEQILQTVNLDPGESKQIGLQPGQSMRVKDSSNQGQGAANQLVLTSPLGAASPTRFPSPGSIEAARANGLRLHFLSFFLCVWGGVESCS